MELHAQDFTRYAATAEPADAVFISPPWGGIGHLERDHFSLQSVDGCDIVAQLPALAVQCRRF